MHLETLTPYIGIKFSCPNCGSETAKSYSLPSLKRNQVMPLLYVCVKCDSLHALYKDKPDV